MPPFSRSPLSRRTLLGGAFGLAGVAAAAACSSDSTTSESSSAASAAPASSSQPATRKVTDSLKRTVEVSTQPQRIVSLQDWASGLAVLSIGGKLVGMTTRDGSYMPQVAKQFDLSKVAEVGEGGKWNLEKIAALEPDLILGSAWEGKPNVEGYDVEKLQAIGPTYFIEDGQTSLEQFMKTIGELTGRTAEVDKQKKEWDERYAQVKAQLAPKTKDMSFAMIGYWPPTVWVNTPHSSSPLIHIGLDAGLKLPPAAAGSGKNRSDYLELTAETLLTVPSDFVIWNRDGKGDPSTMPLWKDLPAVKAGQAFEEKLLPVGWSYHEWNRALDIIKTDVEKSRSDVVKEK